MIASWGMANYVEYNQVKNIFQEIGEIVGIYFSSTRHLAVVDFSTEQAAESVKPYLCCLCCIPGVALHSFYFLMIHVAMFEDDNTVYIDFQALYHFMGYHLMGRPLKLAWFDPKDFAVLRDIPTRGERMPNYLMQTVCVTGFDSSLEIGTIRHALEEIFANDHMKKLVTPVNLDGTSTGKAYIRYDVASSYNGALHCDGVSEIGGRILRVTKWPDFSWCKKRRIGRAGCDKDDAGLAVPDQDDTPKWHTPSTGKRTLFDDGSGDEAGVTM
jgi:hypothetical protein